MRDISFWIRNSLIGSLTLLLGSAIIGGTGGLLCLLGDERGAETALGAAIVAGVGFAVMHILLVTLLALDHRKRNMELDHPEGRVSG